MASSWSLISTSFAFTPWTGSLHMGPFFVASTKPSSISSIVSRRYWTPLVMLMKTLDSKMLDMFRASSLSIPLLMRMFLRSSSSIFMETSPDLIASTTSSSRGSISM